MPVRSANVQTRPLCLSTDSNPRCQAESNLLDSLRRNGQLIGVAVLFFFLGWNISFLSGSSSGIFSSVNGPQVKPVGLLEKEVAVSSVNLFGRAFYAIRSPSLQDELGKARTQKILDAGEALSSAESSLPLPLQWQPPADLSRILLATCVLGQLSNRMVCFRNYLLAATLLNRTLIVPSRDLTPIRHREYNKQLPPYNFNLVIDVSHIRACWGNASAFWLEEFVEMKGQSSLDVDSVWCWFTRCNFDKAGGVPVVPSLVFFGRHETGLPSSLKMQQFVDALAAQKGGRVLCLGDLFYARFLDAPPGFDVGLSLGLRTNDKSSAATLHPSRSYLESDLSFAHDMSTSCLPLIRPHPAILAAAHGFVAEFTGTKFAALHLRRKDFFSYCADKKKCEYWPLRQVAECVKVRMARAGLSLLFLATDLDGITAGVFKSMLSLPLVSGGDKQPATTAEGVAVVLLPASMKGQYWAFGVEEVDKASNHIVRPMMEKLICGMASQFMGTSGSTFSREIRNLRYVFGTVSRLDAEAPCVGLMELEARSVVAKDVGNRG